MGAFFFFIILTGAFFFAGGDLLLVIFTLTTASVFLIVAAYSSNSPYAEVGAERELLSMMAYEPMVLLVIIGFYVACGTFNVSEILAADIPAIVYLPGLFIGYVFILTLKFRKSPFDLSMSHHGHRNWSKVSPLKCRVKPLHGWKLLTGMKTYSCSVSFIFSWHLPMFGAFPLLWLYAF